MLYRNHYKLPRQYRFPISGRSFEYLKSERKMIEKYVPKRMSFILLSWVLSERYCLV